MVSNFFAQRFARVRDEMDAQGIDVCLLSLGADLPWLCGYEAMPLERLTMLVVPKDGDAVLVVPQLEVPRVQPRDEFSVRGWGETEDPISLVAGYAKGAARVAVGDRTWSRFVLALQNAMPQAQMTNASSVIGKLRAQKDQHELAMLQKAASVVDVIAGQLQRGEIALEGKTEAEVSAELSRRIIDGGHSRVNFAIVAAGENSASPHHEPGGRRINKGDVVLCDFGGTMHDEFGVGYCSDITRCVVVGEPTQKMRDVYAVLQQAQNVGVQAGSVGLEAQAVDKATRDIIDAAGYGEWFIHRTGHGIGVEEHEDPYIVLGNNNPLAEGNAYSVEPGIYLPGEFGFRLEDIVALVNGTAQSLNNANHDLASVSA